MTHRRPARLPAALAALTVTLLVLIALVSAPAVLAHAALVTAAPADGATVVGPPAEIVMTFSQALDPARSSLRLVNTADQVVAQDSTVGPGTKTMRLPVPADLPAGEYTVRWTTFSTEDNEQERGTTTFTIVAPTPAPTATPSAAASAAPSPRAVPTTPPSPSPSPGTSSPTASTADVLVPIVVVLAVLAGLGLWLLRSRSRGAS
ncbi:MAG TPA: copper resistance protein CopC [Candidatus Limnocylindrales bacterium]|nr:copper resistance protein CopC [Candidatus Limnocylindrales bacterium]